jgi:replicative DNA helicase
MAGAFPRDTFPRASPSFEIARQSRLRAKDGFRSCTFASLPLAYCIMIKTEGSQVASSRVNFGKTVKLADELEGALKLISSNRKCRNKLQGIGTGFQRLDELTRGWKGGEMIVVATRPDEESASLALTFASHALERRYDPSTNNWTKPGHRVGIFSFELSNKQLMLRLLASLGSESIRSIQRGNLNDYSSRKLKAVARKISKWPLVLADSSLESVASFSAKARRMKADFGIELLIIDQIEFICANLDHVAGNRQSDVAYISCALKSLSRELDIPIIVCVQLEQNRSQKKTTLNLNKFGDLSPLEQHADIVLLLSPTPIKKSEPSPGPIIPYTLQLAKQREGPIDTVDILLNAPYSRFEDRKQPK